MILEIFCHSFGDEHVAVRVPMGVVVQNQREPAGRLKRWKQIQDGEFNAPGRRIEEFQVLVSIRIFV